MKKDVLPPLTTMMLDVLANTLKLPEHSRTKAVCRCVMRVYSINHGVKPPWELTGETPEQCKERVKGQPVTIIDAKAEVTDESTRAYSENRSTGSRHVAVSNSRVSRRRPVSRTNGKRV